MPSNSAASAVSTVSTCPVVVLPESLVAVLYGTVNDAPHIDLKSLRQLHAPARENKTAHETDGQPPSHITVQMGQPVDALIEVYHCDWCEGAFIDVLEDAGLPCYQGFEVRFASGALHTAQGASYCAECTATGQILRCRVCGCTDAAGCAEGCEWAHVDMEKGNQSLCSSCVSGKHEGDDEEEGDSDALDL